MKPPSRDFIALEENERARMLLARLRRGPASTIELQAELPLVHVARQVWELRHWYGFDIKTERTPAQVAIYRLIPPPAPQSVVWRCVKCSARLMGPSEASMDPRWRLARCLGCNTKRAIFERQHS